MHVNGSDVVAHEQVFIFAAAGFRFLAAHYPVGFLFGGI
jgi:hypothetical protein